MHYKLLLIIATWMWVWAATAQPDIHVARFLGDREAAISYTFDDGLEEHYTMVFPQLQRLGLKGSFCIIGSKVGGSQKGAPCMTWEQLKEMAAAGHEITNHGFRHQSMEKLSGETMRFEVQHNDTLIYLKTGVFPRTYFYPGNRKTPESLAFCSRDRVGTRTFQVSLGSRRDSLWLDKWVNGLLKKREWGVTMTHGITVGYDAFPDRPQMLWQHLEQVARMQDCIWVATFRDVAAYVAERDTVQLNIGEEKNGVIPILPVMSLDKSVFRQPLTLVVSADVKEAVQDKKKLLLTKKDDKTLFDFDPQGGKILIKLKKRQ